MSFESRKETVEAQLREAARNAEEEVKRLVNYLNDEVMPDVRRNGSAALRSAATELHKLAERMDEASRPPRP